jgi:hypothetical protein
MKRTLSMVFTGLLITGIGGYAQSTQDTKTAQDAKAGQDVKSDKSTTTAAEDAQRIATGEITKIDAKKKILTVREASLNQPSNSGQNSNASRGGMGGGGMGGGRRRGGMGTGYPGGGGRPAPTSSANKGKEFKVTVTDQTAIKDKVTTIGFDLLRVGDRISIQGLPKGKGDDLQATQITVN